MKKVFLLFFVFFVFFACATSKELKPGPDKQAEGFWQGAILGAGSGAITGLQYSSGAGPGAFIGAGLGAAYGLIAGMGLDAIEERQIKTQEEVDYLKKVTWAQEILSEHYQRRLELHPSRDIFPSDLFFDGDSDKVKGEALVLLEVFADFLKYRKQGSRLMIASYVTSKSSDYSRYLSGKRAKGIALALVKYGIDPRRLGTRGLVLDAPILIDPDDDPLRFTQAVEFVYID